MVRLRGRSEWDAPLSEERVDLPEPDYDPGPTVAAAGGTDDRDGYIAELEGLVAELKDLAEWVPFHAYCTWRENGDRKSADKMDDWQTRRDAAVRQARKMLNEVVAVLEESW